MEDKLIGGSVGGFLTGAFLMARYRSNASLINGSSSYGLAARAITVGSLLSFSTVGLAVGLSAKMLDIHSMKDLRLAVEKFLEGGDRTEYELVIQPVQRPS